MLLQTSNTLAQSCCSYFGTARTAEEACLVQLGHDHGGPVLVSSSRAGEAKPAHGVVLTGVWCRHISQAQVGTRQGAQPLPSKVVDGDHYAPCCLQQANARASAQCCLLQ